ncbi:M1 family metallopeptidase [Ramlibacter sp.]|uniref:M1 family metallopeptidase n=1 Tax=Ramlibacter sp. TaxID=1917967 RepID=UPI002CC0F0E1|nr:M1 family metallopeptidase [Ramlibacter sp.]HWI84431.1 M1 family metallopeptidase [Ramlibacter sp.]
MQSLARRVLALLLAFTATAACAQERFAFDRTDTVLSKAVVPSRVELQLELDPAKDQFGGEVAIDVDVREPVQRIVLHARGLEPARLLLRSGAQLRPLRLAPSDLAQTWALQLEDGQAIAPGRHRLELAYRGLVNAAGEGLFAVEHLAHGRPARMLSTQLEPIHARRLLPCFDEPLFRTVFQVQVRAPAGYTVLSNTDAVSAEPEGDSVRHRFAPTPPMQSYLLAVTVGRFDILGDQVDGVRLRIVTPPGKQAQAAFAMAATKQLLPWYRRYFGRPYALPKLDQVAVPGVRGGAMEDWGLISYDETLLLYDPQHSPQARQQAVFGVVAHEIAHQWFGDLVSPASWNDIWLNEAFATWMQQKASARFHPEWDIELQNRRDIEHTMARDATPATRAIRSGEVGESRVFDVFDDITYKKGGAVLSMLEQWIGPRAFQQGLASYMAERAMKPATAGDLWHHIGQASGRPVAALAATWTDQPGVPVIAVDSRCARGRTRVTLQRSRLAALAPLPPVPWLVPVQVRRGAVLRTALVGAGATTLDFPGCKPLPVIANAGSAGYYRVDAAPALREQLAAALPALAPVDRLALLGDSYALTLAGRRPLADHLALLARLPLVRDAGRAGLYLQAIAQWTFLDETFAGTPAAAAMQRAEQALLAPELERLGWQPASGESSEVARLRGKLVSRLARLGHEPTIATATGLCPAALAGDTRAVAPSVRAGVLQACLRQTSDAQVDAVYRALLASPSQEERWLLLEALAASPDPRRARQLLERAAAGQLPGTFGSRVPHMLAGTPGLGPLVYDFAVEHWAGLAKLAGDTGSRWLLPGAASWAADGEHAQRLARDQARLAGRHGQAAADQTIATIRTRVRLREREVQRVPAMLRDWAPRAPG